MNRHRDHLSGAELSGVLDLVFKLHCPHFRLEDPVCSHVTLEPLDDALQLLVTVHVDHSWALQRVDRDSVHFTWALVLEHLHYVVVVVECCM